MSPFAAAWALSLLLLGSAAAEELHLCVRAQSFDPGFEFQQTRQLYVHVAGAPLEDLMPTLVTRTLREHLWTRPETRIHVEPFTPSSCGNQPSAEITMGLDESKVPAIRAEISRGLAVQPTLNSVVKAALTQPPPPDPQLARPDKDGLFNVFRLYYASTRNSTGKAGAAEAFGSLPSSEVSFGSVDVSIPYDHRWARLESPSVLRLEWDHDPARHVTLLQQLAPMPEDRWESALSSAATRFNKPGVLLFVHGYNTSFPNAARRAAQLAFDLSFPGPTVLFSWPSEGEMLSYMSDEEAARISWRQMSDVLEMLARLGPGVPVYIVAHSMGGRVLTEGMANLLRRRPTSSAAFKEVVLASPDIGKEEFLQRWNHELHGQAMPRYTLYASGQDWPVEISKWLHGGERLGNGGPNTVVLKGLDSIDASSVTGEWFGLNHSYFGDTDTVLADLFVLFHQGADPSQRPRLKAASNARGQYWQFMR